MSNSFRYTRNLILGLVGALLVLGAFNWVVDPFNRNLRVSLGLPKQTVSTLMNYQMYKLLKFENRPQPFIILGDSRSDALKLEFFEEQGKQDVFNFAYGGGTLFEAVDTFWFAAERIELETVVLGIPFCTYSESNSANRFPTARQVTKNPLSYYLSPLVTKASFLNLMTALTGREFVSRVPDLDPDDFWQYQLGPGTEMFYANWKTPNVLQARLEEVVVHCRENGIELVFFIPPVHQELRDRLKEYDLTDEYAAYKDVISALGVVMDYDVPGPLTSNRDNYLDPYHFSEAVSREIVADILGRDVGNDP